MQMNEKDVNEIKTNLEHYALVGSILILSKI